MILLESRKLLKIKVFAQGVNQYFFRVVNYDGYPSVTLRVPFEKLVLFLRRIKAKDTESTPASHRKYPYAVIAQNIVDGTDNEIWVWTNHWRVTTNKIKTEL